jgi:cytochrome c-type biogenesis protein CcmH
MTMLSLHMVSSRSGLGLRAIGSKIMDSCQRFNVIPAKAGVHGTLKSPWWRKVTMAPRLRWDDGCDATLAPMGLRAAARNDIKVLLVSLFLAFSFSSAFAVDPAEQLKDTKLEARAREISAGLRCLVCQNQSIDDSDAPLARDLRLIVRQQLQKGASNGQVVDYIVDRYGEFVLLNPRLHLNTLILWLTPLLLIAGGVVLARRIVRRQPEKASAPPLSPEEQKELDKLLAQPPAKS